jgi:hypothetical protein
MVFLLVSPTIVATLIFGAHLFRGEGFLLVLPLVLSLLLLFVERGWVARFFQVLLLLETLEWARSAITIAIERSEAGQPWLRAVLILSGVGLFTLFAAALFETRTLLRFYPRFYDG